MLVDARNIPDGELIDTDVCIIGAGAAGIQLAREFIGQQFRVTLVESGGLEFDMETQALSQGESTGHSYMPLESSHLRAFGGSTNLWGGTCRPLDESDFEKKDWMPFSGWPIAKTDLDPFYKRAQVACQLGPYEYRTEAWQTPDALPFALQGDQIITNIFQQSPPTNFGRVYRDEVTNATNVNTYIYANVVNIETIASAELVKHLQVATLSGNKFKLSCRIVVIAAGGIESTRILLLSRDTIKAGLGNQNDMLGRFFMEHPIFHVGMIALSDPGVSTAMYQKRTVRDTTVKGFLTSSQQAIKNEQLLNYGARPRPVPMYKVSRGLQSYNKLKISLKEFELPDDFMEHLANVIADIDDVAMSGKNAKVLGLKFWTETSPNPDSRLSLSDKLDSLGQNQSRLNWVLNDMDRRNMNRVLATIGEALGAAGIGRLKLFFDDDDGWPEQMAGSYHHMGSARMSIEPNQGVVDANCRVHGVDNLYVASSAVFPTSGHANPTLTIVALAIRLADHIKEIMV